MRPTGGSTGPLNCSLEQACGISGPFFEVLLRVGRSPGGRLNMSELAEQLGLTSGGTTRLVDRMVAAGPRRSASPARATDGSSGSC